MPIYEYRCEACDRTFELLTSFAERDRAQPCPTCESTRTRVLVSSFASMGSPAEFTSQLPVRDTGGGGCCGGGGGACGCGH